MCVLGRESVCVSLRVWGCNDMYWHVRRSHWPRDLRCGCATARMLGLRVRISTKARTIVVCGCCVLSGRGLCVGLTTLTEESYRVWYVQLAWSRSPVREGHDPKSGRRAIGGEKMAYGGKHVLVLCLKKGMLPTYLVCRNNPSRVQYLLFRFLDYPHPVRLWTCDQLLTETAAYTTHNRSTSMPSTGFKPAIPAIKRPQTDTSDSTNIGIVPSLIYLLLFYDVQQPQRRIKRISLPRVEQIVSCSETSVTYRCFQRGIVAYYKHPYNS
jgi:hypothetical protein